MGKFNARTSRPVTVIDFGLPPGSYCVDMAVINDKEIVCIFDIPERGLETYIYNPISSEIRKIEYK